jgi:hypothetical protein
MNPYDDAIIAGRLTPASAWRGSMARASDRASRTSTQLAYEARTIKTGPDLWHGVRLLFAFAVWTAAVVGICSAVWIFG